MVTDGPDHMYEHTLMKWQLSDPPPPLPWRGWRVELRPVVVAFHVAALLAAVLWALSPHRMDPGWQERERRRAEAAIAAGCARRPWPHGPHLVP
jgi:hypothetical protein